MGTAGVWNVGGFVEEAIAATLEVEDGALAANNLSASSRISSRWAASNGK